MLGSSFPEVAAGKISGDAWAWTHVTLANHKLTTKWRQIAVCWLYSAQHTTGISGFLITTVSNSTSRVHALKVLKSQHSSRSALAVVETPATICKSGSVLVRSICANDWTQKALPIMYLFQKFVYVMSTKKKIKIIGSCNCKKIIEHLKHMPSRIGRTLLFCAILANLHSNGYDELWEQMALHK